MFFIGFVTGARVNEEGLRYAEGELTLGRDRERFRSDLGTWFYRVRGVNPYLVAGAQKMTWSPTVKIRITGDEFTVVK